MTSTQSPFNDPPPYSDTSSWANDFDSPEENEIPPAKVRSAPEPVQATQTITELKQGPETEKLKEFLTFVMFRDYAGLFLFEGGCYTLRDSTRDHFLRIAEQIKYVNGPTHGASETDTSERCAKDSNGVDDEWYFWRNIYEP